MSEQPTPETDAEVTINAINDDGYAVPCVDIEFARKLERERDEAREALDEEMKFHHRTHAELVQTQCQMQDVIREREASLEAAK
jgi:hypothetical protein